MPSMTTLIRNGDLAGIDRALTLDPDLADGFTEQGFSYLMFAAYFGNVAIMNRIGQDKSNWTLYDAIAVGDLERVSDMVEEDPQLMKSQSSDGITALALSAYFEHQELVLFFLDRGADPSEPVKNAMAITPLHAACARGNDSMVRLLLEKGANPNSQQANGTSPLHSAVHRGMKDAVEALLAHGADVLLAMEDGRTPLDFAKAEGHEQIESILLSALGNI